MWKLGSYSQLHCYEPHLTPFIIAQAVLWKCNSEPANRLSISSAFLPRVMPSWSSPRHPLSLSLSPSQSHHPFSLAFDILSPCHTERWSKFISFTHIHHEQWIRTSLGRLRLEKAATYTRKKERTQLHTPIRTHTHTHTHTHTPNAIECKAIQLHPQP